MAPPLEWRAGQAMIEFIIGLMVVVLLFAGMLQFIDIASAHSETLSEARAIAGDLSLNGSPISGTPEYMLDWEEGPDEMRHTSDDEPVLGSLSGTQRGILDLSVPDPGDWPELDERVNNDISELRAGTLPMALFGFVQGEESVSIPLWAAMRQWVYSDESVEVRAEVWLPRAGGLY